MLKLFWLILSSILIGIIIFQTPQEILGLSDLRRKFKLSSKLLTVFGILLYFVIVLTYNLI